MCIHFLALIRVTGQTGRLNIINRAEIHLHGVMRMVARRAIFKSIVVFIFRCMTHGACWNDTFFRRWMLQVAIDAVDLFVCRSSFVYFLYRTLMTTGA
ncbi:MAG: hypothetical protein BA872_00365 [Desulfobacterales bacterium C00003060]|nr:MAG: hypothetical protein BA872_00365 [Desulfobacterales bacterium C00003060]